MKAFFIGLLFLGIVAVGGYIFLRQYSGSHAAKTSYQTSSVTRTGVLEKSSLAGVDYQYIIVSGGQSWGVTSQSLDLSRYVGKKVSATGQNSGTTLYADTVSVVQ